jgi:hypothetical protein
MGQGAWSLEQRAKAEDKREKTKETKTLKE